MIWLSRTLPLLLIFGGIHKKVWLLLGIYKCPEKLTFLLLNEIGPFEKFFLSTLKSQVYLQEQLLFPYSDYKIDFWLQKKRFFPKRCIRVVQKSVIFYFLNNFSLRWATEKIKIPMKRFFAELLYSKDFKTFHSLTKSQFYP